MEVEAAARRRMLGDDTIRGLVGDWVWKYRAGQKIDGTGKCGIVFKRNGGWATPDPAHTSEYPLLVAEFWADHTREPDGTFDTANAEDRAFGLYRAADPLLSRSRGEWWGAFGSNRGLMVVTSQRWTEPILVTEDDQHRTAPLQNSTIMGDAVYVRVQYALNVIH